MRRFTTAVLILSASAGTAYAQRGGGDWTTEGNDAQRSSWVRADPKINRDSIQKPDFKFYGRSLDGQPAFLRDHSQQLHWLPRLSSAGIRGEAPAVCI